MAEIFAAVTARARLPSGRADRRAPLGRGAGGRCHGERARNDRGARGGPHGRRATGRQHLDRRRTVRRRRRHRRPPRTIRSGRWPPTGRASTRPRATASCTRGCTGCRRSRSATATSTDHARTCTARPASSRSSAAALVDGRRPTVFGDGRQTRDWVDVSDVARANLMAAEADDDRAVQHRAGRETSVLDLIDALADVGNAGLARRSRVRTRTARRGQPQLSRRDARESRARLAGRGRAARRAPADPCRPLEPDSGPALQVLRHPRRLAREDPPAERERRRRSARSRREHRASPRRRPRWRSSAGRRIDEGVTHLGEHRRHGIDHRESLEPGGESASVAR